jgi:polyisoprenoid-binding protein YceI
VRKCRTLNFKGLFFLAVAVSVHWLPVSKLRADSEYTAKTGKINFSVDANISFLKVSGSSSAIKGGGQATVEGNAVTVRNVHFEVDPRSFKTGISLRDQHLYERVFTATDGSVPPVVLRAERFQATPNGSASTWEGNLHAQLTIRGVTKPVVFRALLEKQGDGAVVTAHGTVKTSNFGVKPITYSGASVEDEVAVTVSNLRLEP